MLGLGKADVGHPAEDPLQADPHLGAGNRSARARVNSAAECHVMQYVRAVEAEFVGFVEPPRITVGRTVHHQNAGAGLHLDVADPGGAPRETEIRFDRAFDAQHLLDEGGDL